MKKGNGFLDIDLKRNKMGNNSLYCILPGQLHQLEIGEAEGYIISFSERLLNSGSDDFELMLDCHGRLSPSNAIRTSCPCRRRISASVVAAS